MLSSSSSPDIRNCGGCGITPTKYRICAGCKKDVIYCEHCFYKVPQHKPGHRVFEKHINVSRDTFEISTPVFSDLTSLLELVYNDPMKSQIRRKIDNETDFLTPSELYNSLKHTNNMIVVDLRPPESFHSSHIFESLNLDINSFDDKQRDEKYSPLSVLGLLSHITKKAEIKKCHLVFVLGEYNQTLDGASEIKVTPKGELISNLQNYFGKGEHVAEIRYLDDYTVFEKAYKFLCVSSDNELPKVHFSEYPSEIIPGFLYLGSFNEISKKELLQLGVGHILNVASECANISGESFVYTKRNIMDTVSENLSLHFEEAFRCIERARSENSGIVIHCYMGISRSASITIAYLMKCNNWDLKTALTYVKSCRPFIQPNDGFMRVLYNYEKFIKGGIF